MEGQIGDGLDGWIEWLDKEFLDWMAGLDGWIGWLDWMAGLSGWIKESLDWSDRDCLQVCPYLLLNMNTLATCFMYIDIVYQNSKYDNT